MNQLVPVTSPTLPALVATAGDRAGMRFLEFFAANIRNPHTRRAYVRAADEFMAWCASVGAVSPGYFAQGRAAVTQPPQLTANPELMDREAVSA